MRRSDFRYFLPDSQIAQYPLPERTDSRLMILDGEGGGIVDASFPDLVGRLRAGDLLVFNDTRVVPARLFGRKETGGRVEVLIERQLDGRRALAHVKASKAPRVGRRMVLADTLEVQVSARQGDLFELCLEGAVDWSEALDRHGHIPLPPYIQRPDGQEDVGRYQTVYARQPGAVAAPTAGLHFDQPILDRLRANGVDFGYVTLHVGAGTFQPVRVDDLDEHPMHKEWLEVSQRLCDQVDRARTHGGRVVAIGTTAVRCLEAAWVGGRLRPYRGDTDLFIRPEYSFRVVDGLLTNFHLPESTLLMLVCAFAGYGEVMSAYRHGVKAGYRFFSYGDAMFLTRKKSGAANRGAAPKIHQRRMEE